MKKLILFVFILLLLSIASWGVSSWYLGNKTLEYMVNLSEEIKQNPNALFTFDIIKYNKSVFNAKADIRLNINSDHDISRLLGNVGYKENNNNNNNLNIHDSYTYGFSIDITHGPFFNSPKGLLKVSSTWVFSLDENHNSQEKTVVEELLNTLKVFVNFEDILVYELPLTADFSEYLALDMFINGSYDLRTSDHNGSIKSNELKYLGDNHSLVATGVDLRFQQRDMSNNESLRFKVSGELPNLRYAFKLFPEPVTLSANYIGDFSLIKDELNIYNQLLFDMTSKSQYPIEKGDLRFKVSKLDFDSLRDLNAEVSRINNVQDQVQWVLEEQGAFPEGQDKMWELQDQGARLFKKLPVSVSKAFFTEDGSKPHDVNNARLRFYLKTEYNNEDSIINGAFYPATVGTSELDLLSDHPQNLILSLSSLIYPQAEIAINDDWLTYLSSRLPIAENNFTLSYENKQLLMQ